MLQLILKALNHFLEIVDLLRKWGYSVLVDFIEDILCKDYRFDSFALML